MQPHPVIFLDLDDVLVLDERAWELFEAVGGEHEEPERVYAEAFAGGALANLLQLLDEFPTARVVISSSWRKSFGREQLAAVLTRCGAGGLVQRLHERDPHTPQLDGRLAEIRGWLAKHRGDICTWCAIDDRISGASLAAFLRDQPEHLDSTRLILCDPAMGFSEDDLQRARQALQADVPSVSAHPDEPRALKPPLK